MHWLNSKCMVELLTGKTWCAPDISCCQSKGETTNCDGAICIKWSTASKAANPRVGVSTPSPDWMMRGRRLCTIAMPVPPQAPHCMLVDGHPYMHTTSGSHMATNDSLAYRAGDGPLLLLKEKCSHWYLLCIMQENSKRIDQVTKFLQWLHCHIYVELWKSFFIWMTNIDDSLPQGRLYPFVMVIAQGVQHSIGSCIIGLA